MEAQEWFDKALVIDPQSTIILNNKGHSLLKLKKFDKAMQCFDQILQINPKCGKNYSAKGEALKYFSIKYSLIYIGEFQQAIHCFETGIQKDPQFAGNYNNKGLVLNYEFLYLKLTLTQTIRSSPRMF